MGTVGNLRYIWPARRSSLAATDCSPECGIWMTARLSDWQFPRAQVNWSAAKHASPAAAAVAAGVAGVAVVVFVAVAAAAVHK